MPDHNPPKTMSKSFLIHLAHHFREYCSKTSIHGVQYLGEKKRTPTERSARLWWSAAFAVCFGLCFWVVVKAYEKWRSSPVLVTFATEETPIYQIPFPAVTICPEAQFEKSFDHKQMERLIKMGELSTEKQKEYSYFKLICDSDWPSYSNISLGNGSDFFEIISKATPKNSFVSCGIFGHDINCESIFKPILTDQGICYTFNMLNPAELFSEDVTKLLESSEGDEPQGWSLEEGYPENTGLHTFPRRALLSGAKNGLEIFLLTKTQSIDYGCKYEGLQGYKVTLHVPQRLPRVTQDYFQVPLDHSIVASVYPELIKTSSEVRRYDPQRRQCFFTNERKLRYFLDYTRLNCEMECLSNFTWKNCGCVHYFLPRTEEMGVCGGKMIRCMETAETSLEMAQLTEKLKNSKNDSLQEDEVDCGCLPLCVDLTYIPEISQNIFDWKATIEAKDEKSIFSQNASLFRMTHLKLYFKNSRIVTLERTELHSPISFLANFGGLLGLFMGFSVLSLLELIYFATLRIICNLRIHGSWSGKR